MRLALGTSGVCPSRRTAHSAEWSEIDLDNAEWRIPGAKMKMRDHALNRHIRVAELLDPRTRQTIGTFPPLLDAALVALDETSMTLTGTERIEDSQATREYLYAQSWFLQAVWGSHPCLYSDRD